MVAARPADRLTINRAELIWFFTLAAPDEMEDGPRHREWRYGLRWRRVWPVARLNRYSARS